MRFVTHTLTLVLMLVVGFVVGARYQAVVDNVEGLQGLVAVQKSKIAELKEANTHLTTVVRLREILDANRVRLPRESVEAMASRIDQVSRKYAISPDMIFAVIQVESAFDPMAVSNKGAMGLMQLLPSTARAVAEELNIQWTGDGMLWDPATNIEMGTYYLRSLISRFNNIEVALTAYNHGPTRVAEMQATNLALPLGYQGRVLAALPAQSQ
jgi:soluble lytic murein transglycosylase